MSDFQEPTFEVWDCNWDVLALYAIYSTQWRAGAGGLYGLDFNVFHHALDRKGINGAVYDQWIADLMVIESAALVALNK